jgi:hypothetical protein
MTDSSLLSGTITRLLRQLPSKDEQVVHDVFTFYFEGLARRAKTYLNSLGGVRISDQEDLAMLVITAFLRDAAEGEIGELKSRHDVWRMLSKRLRLRAINMVVGEKGKKKHELTESGFNGHSEEDKLIGIDQFAGRSIDDLSQFHREMITSLKDPIARKIAELLFEGKDVKEICKELNKAPTTVYRKISDIKDTWIASS